MIEVKNRAIAVVGGARSGLAAARMLKKRGAEVLVSDASTIDPEVKSALEREQIAWEEKQHTRRAREVNLAVVSPGVPDNAPLMKYYAEAGIPVYSEIEAASWFNRRPVIAVTGTNGKTTVTSWLEHTWKTAGKPCLLAGNIGQAFSGIVDDELPDATVILEVSSFQLDHIRWFRPSVSVILNITADHLDRYENSFEKYAASKLRITENQQAEDIFIYNYDDPFLAERAKALGKKKGRPRLLACSTAGEVPQGIFVRDGQIIFKLNDTENDTATNAEEILMKTGDVRVPGKHNLSNGLATALTARVSEIKSESIRESLKTFEGVEHRLEVAGEVGGVRYINDSKATNINAVWYALDSFDVPMVLILGGRDKGNDYTELKDQVVEKVHTLIAIGEAREAIGKQLGGVVPCFLEADTMGQAVRQARKQAKRGEIVLLSPACASFDMFKDYEHRGEEFKKAVMEL